MSDLQPLPLARLDCLTSKLPRVLTAAAAKLFTFLALNAAQSFIRFGRVRRQFGGFAKWKKLKAFAFAHRRDEERQAFYILASRPISSIIAKARLKHDTRNACLLNLISNQSVPSFY